MHSNRTSVSHAPTRASTPSAQNHRAQAVPQANRATVVSPAPARPAGCFDRLSRDGKIKLLFIGAAEVIGGTLVALGKESNLDVAVIAGGVAMGVGGLVALANHRHFAAACSRQVAPDSILDASAASHSDVEAAVPPRGHAWRET